MTIVPPGGFAGFAQMAAASRAALTPRGSRSGSRRRRRAATRGRAKKTRRAKKSRKLKFGSAAWRKKYMRKRK